MGVRVDSAIKRSLMWAFLTGLWGFVPGGILFAAVGLADHARHTWATSLAWGLVATVIFGGSAALLALYKTGYPRTRSNALSKAVGAAIALDIVTACFGTVLVGVFYPGCGCS